MATTVTGAAELVNLRDWSLIVFATPGAMVAVGRRYDALLAQLSLPQRAAYPAWCPNPHGLAAHQLGTRVMATPGRN